jgi:glutamate synthase (NADPH/NADH) large chain
MVELEPLDGDDEAFLLDTLRRHRELTGSTVAERILAQWAAQVSTFRKVMPKDYKRVLNVMRQAEEEGLDEAATLHKVMETSRG